MLSAEHRLALTTGDKNASILESRIKRISDSIKVHMEMLLNDSLKKIVRTDEHGNYTIQVKPGHYCIIYEYFDGVHCEYKEAK